MIQSFEPGSFRNIREKICRAAKDHEDQERKKQQQKVLHHRKANEASWNAKQKSPTDPGLPWHSPGEARMGLVCKASWDGDQAQTALGLWVAGRTYGMGVPKGWGHLGGWKKGGSQVLKIRGGHRLYFGTGFSLFPIHHDS